MPLDGEGIVMDLEVQRPNIVIHICKEGKAVMSRTTDAMNLLAKGNEFVHKGNIYVILVLSCTFANCSRKLYLLYKLEEGLDISMLVISWYSTL